MAVRTVFLVALLALIALASAMDRDVDEGGLRIRVLRRSGKIRVARESAKGKKKDVSKDNGVFVIEIGHLKQKDAQERDVGKSVLSLVKQDFNISVDKNSNYEGVSAVHINLDAYLPAPQAYLYVDIYIFRGVGNVTFGNETTEVQKGTMKFFLEVKNFTFCDGRATNTSICRANETGKYLELAIVVKGRKGEKPKPESDNDRMKRLKHTPSRRMPKGMQCKRGCSARKVYRVGEDDVMAYSQEYKTDGQFGKMPDRYPMLMEKGGRQMFIFRCRKFNGSVIFDPYLEVAGEDDSDDGSDATSIQLNVFMFIVLLGALLMM